MSAKTKIDKAIFNVLLGSIKDNVSNEILNSERNGTFKLENQEQLKNLILMVQNSIDVGYHKASQTLSKQIDDALKK